MTAADLRAKFENDLKRLQQECKHEELSKWMDEYWAPGHRVIVCLKCEKIVTRVDERGATEIEYEN